MITSMDKALVAAIMGVLSLLAIWFGYDFSRINEEWLLSVIAIVTPVLVWLVPNRAAQTTQKVADLGR